MQCTAGEGVLGVCDPPFTLPPIPSTAGAVCRQERLSGTGAASRCRCAAPGGVLEGPADILLAQSESLFTSGISQRHIKESRQVQVNHEMVTF